jgi:hypothetical protein
MRSGREVKMKMKLALLCACVVAVADTPASFAQSRTDVVGRDEFNKLKEDVEKLREFSEKIASRNHYNQTSQVVGNATYIWILDEQTGDIRLCFNMIPSRDLISCGKGP